jgi:hypothetical protein
MTWKEPIVLLNPIQALIVYWEREGNALSLIHMTTTTRALSIGIQVGNQDLL